MQLLGLSEEVLDVLEEIESSVQEPDEEREERSFEKEQELQEMLSEGTLGQKPYDPRDDIGIACDFLENIRKGKEAIL